MVWWVRTLMAGVVFAVCFGTAQADVSDYYATARDKTGEELRQALHEIIREHEDFSYDEVWNVLIRSDVDPVIPNNVILFYSGRSAPKSHWQREFNSNDAWNREHVWPSSHGFRSESQAAHTDAHHIRPADRTVNSSRSDRDFDEGGEPHPEALGARHDTGTFEPPDRVKGDVARMLFYVDVRYQGDGDTPDLELVDELTDSDEPGLGKLCVLLEWHVADPVDAFERGRHEKVAELQGNRNPFIDQPDWALRIWGDSCR